MFKIICLASLIVLPYQALAFKDNSMAQISPPPHSLSASCNQLDDDHDGINNCNDQCPNSLVGEKIYINGCPYDIQININLNSSVNFDTNKHELKKESQNSLRDLAKILMEFPDTKVKIKGYTDSIGSNSYNQKLSEKRAHSVRSFLVLNGINENRIEYVGMGEKDPIADNKTKDGRKENRRVEIINL